MDGPQGLAVVEPGNRRGPPRQARPVSAFRIDGRERLKGRSRLARPAFKLHARFILRPSTDVEPRADRSAHFNDLPGAVSEPLLGVRILDPCKCRCLCVI